MLKQLLIVLAVLVSIPIFLRLLCKLRLLPLAVCGVLIKVVFAEWAGAHPFISTGIIAAIAFLTVLSWIWPLFRRLQEERLAQRQVLNTIRQAEAMGLTDDQYRISLKDGIPVIQYEE